MAPSGVVSGMGGGTATLVVQNNGGSASFANIALVNENPGIFTLSGQAAVLNYYDATSGSYTIHSSKNTAPRGSTIVIFATGLGAFRTSRLGR